VIFSGFVTEQRVASYENLFRRKISEGVPIRCVTRPPKENGSIPVDQGKAALDGLEHFGCVVDTRGEIHEKVAIIDSSIVWFGSLNPLSHTSRTDEVMARLEANDLAIQLATFMSLDRGQSRSATEGASVRAENPRCPKCSSRTAYRKGRYGPYWDCEKEDCGWRESVNKPRPALTSEVVTPTESPNCSACGAPMVLRISRYGKFFGCTKYPSCQNKTKAN